MSHSLPRPPLTRSIWLTASAVFLSLGLALAQGGPGGPGGGNGGGGGGGGGGGNGGGPPNGEEAVNYLSFPAAMTTGTPNTDGLDWIPPLGGGILGVNYSYGCAIPVEDFPNTSCYDEATSTFTTASVCTAAGADCAGQDVSRIYWQKVSTNYWWADTTAVAPSFEATSVDWGDNLESVSWKTTSVIRVETTPYATVIDSLKGFQMWHVLGHGPDEQWGVRATDSATPQPYVYGSDPMYPFLNPSIYTTDARLEATKLGALQTAACPSTTNPYAPPAFSLTWDAVARSWVGADAVEVLDEPFTAELNVGGKYVHGYNLMMRRVSMPAGYSKGGWWRLTFYSTSVTMAPGALLTPPVLPSAEPFTTAVEPAEETEGPLYTAVVDSVNDLTYIDICIDDQLVSGGAGGSGKVPPGKRKIPPGQLKKMQ